MHSDLCFQTNVYLVSVVSAQTDARPWTTGGRESFRHGAFYCGQKGRQKKVVFPAQYRVEPSLWTKGWHEWCAVAWSLQWVCSLTAFIFGMLSLIGNVINVFRGNPEYFICWSDPSSIEPSHLPSETYSSPSWFCTLVTSSISNQLTFIDISLSYSYTYTLAISHCWLSWATVNSDRFSSVPSSNEFARVNGAV